LLFLFVACWFAKWRRWKRAFDSFLRPLALLILTGETPLSLFLALDGRRLLKFRHSDQAFTS
jgi:tellurite resistance protein TehA-like permease